MLIISHKSSADFRLFLEKLNLAYILTTSNPRLDPRIADHPDLSIFALDSETLVIDEGVYDYYAKKLPGKNIIKGEPVSRAYPYDSIYNVYKAHNFYIHNELTEKNIEAYLKANDYRHLKIKQGYSRCSIIPMGDKILTADYGIYKGLNDKLEVILLPAEAIPLDGFDQGFLGGCCGLINDTLIFTGNIEKLKSYDLIKKEADKAGIALVYPKDIDLVDLGSILYIDQLSNVKRK